MSKSKAKAKTAVRKKPAPAPEHVFQEGGYQVRLTGEGVKYEKDGEEVTRSYEDVKVYRAISRKRVDEAGNEKLYFTAPFPYTGNYNKLCFKEGSQIYRTHEFSGEEKAKVEATLRSYSVPIVDRKKGAGVAKPPIKTFREDGGITHRLVAIAIFVFVMFVIGAVIMYLINYFLQTDTESLAIVFGIFCLPCLIPIILKSQELGSKIIVSEKGVQLTIRSKSGYSGTNSPFAIDKAYFNWDEVECVERVQSQVDFEVRFRLGYSVYTIPDFGGLYDYIASRFPQKCKEGEERIG